MGADECPIAGSFTFINSTKWWKLTTWSIIHHQLLTKGMLAHRGNTVTTKPQNHSFLSCDYSHEALNNSETTKSPNNLSRTLNPDGLTQHQSNSTAQKELFFIIILPWLISLHKPAHTFSNQSPGKRERDNKGGQQNQENQHGKHKTDQEGKEGTLSEENDEEWQRLQPAAWAEVVNGDARMAPWSALSRGRRRPCSIRSPSSSPAKSLRHSLNLPRRKTEKGPNSYPVAL